MNLKEDTINSNVKNYTISISRNNSDIKFIAIADNPLSNDNNIIKIFDNISDKICYYCGSKFYSKFNRDRHISLIHLKSELTKCDYCNHIFQNLERHIKTCSVKNSKTTSNDAIERNNNNNIITNNSNFIDNSNMFSNKHTEQEDEPLYEYLPAGQNVQEEEPLLEY